MPTHPLTIPKVYTAGEPVRPPIVVVGEALIDLCPWPAARVGGRQVGDEAEQAAGASALMIALPGGSCANVALALARLDVPVHFVARLATAGFGVVLRQHLSANGIDVSRSVPAAENATVALVTVDEHGSAAYTFYGKDTADWHWRRDELPDPPSLVGHTVHTGSLSLAIPPGADVLLAWLADVAASPAITVSVDPNVRLGVVDDAAAARERILAAVRFADIVKVSEEDLTAVYPGETPLRIAQRWATCEGPALVVVTHGAHGATALRRGADSAPAVHCAAPVVNVRDTIGAGDTFTAALLARLRDRGLLDRGRLCAIGDSELAASLEFATRAGAIACTRIGANPPRLADLVAPRL
jgi:fructokinase